MNITAKLTTKSGKEFNSECLYVPGSGNYSFVFGILNEIETNINNDPIIKYEIYVSTPKEEI